MTTVGIADGMKYGLKLFGLIVGLFLFSGLLIGGGLSLATPGEFVTDGVRDQISYLAGGGILSVVGMVVFYAGSIGIVHKLIADSVSVGIAGPGSVGSGTEAASGAAGAEADRELDRRETTTLEERGDAGPTGAALSEREEATGTEDRSEPAPTAGSESPGTAGERETVPGTAGNERTGQTGGEPGGRGEPTRVDREDTGGRGEEWTPRDAIDEPERGGRTDRGETGPDHGTGGPEERDDWDAAETAASEYGETDRNPDPERPDGRPGDTGQPTDDSAPAGSGSERRAQEDDWGGGAASGGDDGWREDQSATRRTDDPVVEEGVEEPPPDEELEPVEGDFDSDDAGIEDTTDEPGDWEPLDEDDI